MDSVQGTSSDKHTSLRTLTHWDSRGLSPYPQLWEPLSFGLHQGTFPQPPQPWLRRRQAATGCWPSSSTPNLSSWLPDFAATVGKAPMQGNLETLNYCALGVWRLIEERKSIFLEGICLTTSLKIILEFTSVILKTGKSQCLDCSMGRQRNPSTLAVGGGSNHVLHWDSCSHSGQSCLPFPQA